MNEQEQFWAGDGGDAYTERNRYDWRMRIPFWKSIIDKTGARSVYEFGCNVGYNLSAIRRAFPDVQVRGHDINLVAAIYAKCAGLNVERAQDRPLGVHSELSFTAGVLIHIAPENLRAFMQRVIDASSGWVLAVEYDVDIHLVSQEVEYRGRTGLLWRRDYGALYENMGLQLAEKTFLARPAFDNCHAWLMRKP